MLVGGLPGRHELPAVVAALATERHHRDVHACSNGTGVRTSGSVAGYTGWLVLLNSVITLAYVYVAGRRRSGLLGQLRRHAGLGLLGGALSLAAYGLVLWAATRGPLAPISALRETSIVAGRDHRCRRVQGRVRRR